MDVFVCYGMYVMNRCDSYGQEKNFEKSKPGKSACTALNRSWGCI